MWVVSRDAMRAKSTESCSGVSPKRRSSCTSVGFLMGIRFRIRIFSGRISCVRARASLMVTIPSFFNSVMASRPSAILIGKVKTSLGRQSSKGFLGGMGSGRAWTKGLWKNKKLSSPKGREFVLPPNFAAASPQMPFKVRCFHDTQAL